MSQNKVYAIYQCPRCIKFIMDREGMRIGFCTANNKRIPVIKFPEFNLLNTPEYCKDWIKGKHKK